MSEEEPVWRNILRLFLAHFEAEIPVGASDSERANLMKIIKIALDENHE